MIDATPSSGPQGRCIGCGDLQAILDPDGLCAGCRAELDELLADVAAAEEREFADREGERAYWRDQI